MIQIKRPIVTTLIGAIIGIIYGLYFKISIALLVILIIYLLFLIQKNKHKVFYYFAKRRKVILIIILSAIISNLYFIFINQKYETFYKNISENIQTTATVVSEAKETDYYYSYEIKVEGKKLILYVKKSYPQKLKYGMWISLEGTYQEPQEATNYKGFNYKEYLKTKKIYGSIKANEIIIIKENNVNIILKLFNNARNKIIKTAENILPQETSGLVTEILIGEKKNIEKEITESFSKASLSHILAISGTHISYIIVGISFLLTKSKISKKSAYITTIILLIIFMFITRFAPSVVRACIMGIIMLLSKVVYRKNDIINSIAISLIIILIYNPFSIRDIGLQLSYLGTLGIVFLNKPISTFLSKYINKKIAAMLAVTLSAEIMIFPIAVLNFNTISTMFLISNIVAVPLSGAIILYGYVNIFVGMISFKIGKSIAIILNELVKILIYVAKYTAKIPFSSITVTTPSIITVICYYIMIYSIYNKKCVKKVTAAVTIIVLVISFFNIIPKEMRIHFVDVGQRRLYSNRNTFKEKDYSRYWRKRKYCC